MQAIFGVDSNIGLDTDDASIAVFSGSSCLSTSGVVLHRLGADYAVSFEVHMHSYTLARELFDLECIRMLFESTLCGYAVISLC